MTPEEKLQKIKDILNELDKALEFQRECYRKEWCISVVSSPFKLKERALEQIKKVIGE